MTVGDPAVDVVKSELVRDRTPWPEDDYRAYSPREAVAVVHSPAGPGPGGRASEGAFTSLMAASREGSTVVVTHAFVIAWIATHVVSGPADSWVRMPVDNASITTVEHDRQGDLLLRRFNSVVD